MRKPGALGNTQGSAAPIPAVSAGAFRRPPSLHCPPDRMIDLLYLQMGEGGAMRKDGCRLHAALRSWIIWLVTQSSFQRKEVAAAGEKREIIHLSPSSLTLIKTLSSPLSSTSPARFPSLFLSPFAAVRSQLTSSTNSFFLSFCWSYVRKKRSLPGCCGKFHSVRVVRGGQGRSESDNEAAGSLIWPQLRERLGLLYLYIEEIRHCG